MIKTPQRWYAPGYAPSSIVFDSPAPASAVVHFIAVGGVELSFNNGQTYVPAQKQSGSDGRGGNYTGIGYRHPVPEGADRFTIRLTSNALNSPIGAENFVIFAVGEVPPTPTSTATPSPSPTPTSTPTPTATPTSTPEPDVCSGFYSVNGVAVEEPVNCDTGALLNPPIDGA
jgi:hypothetical protein